MTDRSRGIYQGRALARRFSSPDGLTILVGKSAEENDLLSIRLADARDFWYHVAGESGSHVLVLNPDGLDRPPRDTDRLAAALAAGYSRLRSGGQVAVHAALAGDVSKRRGQPPGEVTLASYRTLRVAPLRAEDLPTAGAADEPRPGGTPA